MGFDVSTYQAIFSSITKTCPYTEGNLCKRKVHKSLEVKEMFIRVTKGLTQGHRGSWEKSWSIAFGFLASRTWSSLSEQPFILFTVITHLLPQMKEKIKIKSKSKHISKLKKKVVHNMYTTKQLFKFIFNCQVFFSPHSQLRGYIWLP